VVFFPLAFLHKYKPEDISDDKEQPVRMADNLTAIDEPIV
jgi:hypothetical protein